MNIGEIDVTELLYHHRRKHCQEYREIGRELEELERQVKSKRERYDWYTDELKKIDAASKIARNQEGGFTITDMKNVTTADIEVTIVVQFEPDGTPFHDISVSGDLKDRIKDGDLHHAASVIVDAVERKIDKPGG